MVAMGKNVEFAFDRSMRHRDVDGRLHVESSHISKAMVCPYMGSEIPNAEAMGLDLNKVYYLLRDPEELRRAAPTFRNLPVLIQHVPVSAEKPRQDLIVGTTGSEVTFDGTYLDTSLAIWTAEAIAGIESKEQTELSSAYRYRADMTPGVYQGMAYDGVMRDLVGNHVALVEVGRAGSDVVVSDSLPLQELTMKLTAKAKIIAATLRPYLATKLAQDKAIGSLANILGGVATMAYDAQRPLIAAAVRKEFAGKLATGATLDDLDDALEALSLEKLVLATDARPLALDAKKLAKDEGEEDDEYAEDEEEETAAMDTEGDPDAPKKPEDGAPKPKKKAAMSMDAATVESIVNKRVTAAVAKATADTNALHQARADVLPLVGEVALDSAEAVYKFALDQMGVDSEGVHPSAYRALLNVTKKQGQQVKTPTRLAQDSTTRASTHAAFPNLARIGRL